MRLVEQHHTVVHCDVPATLQQHHLEELRWVGTTQHTSVCGTHPSEQQADRLQPQGRYTLAADAENDRFVTLMYQFDLYLAYGGCS